MKPTDIEERDDGPIQDGRLEEEQAKRHGEMYFRPHRKRMHAWQNQPIHEEICGGDKLLDVGCGVGTLLFGLEKNIAYTGVDTSKNALSIIKDNFDIDAFEMDAIDLKFPDSSFDKIVFRGTLYHIRDQEEALKEACRVLKPDGKILIFEGAADGSIFRKIIMFLADILDPMHEISTNPHNSIKDIKRMAEKSGLKLAKTVKIPGFAVPFVDKISLSVSMVDVLISITEMSGYLTHWHNLVVLEEKVSEE